MYKDPYCGYFQSVAVGSICNPIFDGRRLSSDIQFCLGLVYERSLMLAACYVLMVIVCGDKGILSEVVFGDAEICSACALICIVQDCCGTLAYKLLRGSAPPAYVRELKAKPGKCTTLR